MPILVVTLVDVCICMYHIFVYVSITSLYMYVSHLCSDNELRGLCMYMYISHLFSKNEPCNQFVTFKN